MGEHLKLEWVGVTQQVMYIVQEQILDSLGKGGLCWALDSKRKYGEFLAF